MGAGVCSLVFGATEAESSEEAEENVTCEVTWQVWINNKQQFLGGIREGYSICFRIVILLVEVNKIPEMIIFLSVFLVNVDVDTDRIRIFLNDRP